MHYPKLLKPIALVAALGTDLLQAGNASAVPLQLLLESDSDGVGGSEVFLATFDSIEAFLNFDLADSAFSDIDIGPGFSVGGLTALVPEVAEVHEPESVMLLGVGLLVLYFFVLRQRPTIKSEA